MHFTILQAVVDTTSQMMVADTTGQIVSEVQAVGGMSPVISQVLFFGALFAIMYFLMIRPQQKRAKETQKMLDSLQVNDRVVTSSGIYGRVVSIKPDKGIVVVEIDDTNKIRVDFQRSAIVSILNINTDAK